jgi:hypothetical protein
MQFKGCCILTQTAEGWKCQFCGEEFTAETVGDPEYFHNPCGSEPKPRSTEEAAALTALPCEVRGKTTAALNGVPLEGICLALKGCDGTYKMPCLTRAKSGLPCPLGKFPANCP